MDEKVNAAYIPQLDGLKAPLGIILFLIRKNNLDIYDIPIARITREYLEYLDMMENLNIELAGEFFVMASTLMRIKVQMLLRKREEEEDPRAELVRSLLEYQKMAEAANALRDLEEHRQRIFTRSVARRDREIEPDVELELNLFELMKAFREIAANLEETTVSEIEREEITIEEKMEAIMEALSVKEQLAFQELFTSDSSRLELIVTFVALLELIRRSAVKARQSGSFGAIWLYRNVEQGLDVDKRSNEEPADGNPASIDGI